MRGQVGVEALHTTGGDEEEDLSELEDEAIDDVALLERLDALGLYTVTSDVEEGHEGSADEWEDLEYNIQG